MRKYSGSILIEISVAATIAVIGLGAVLLGFIQANRSAARTNLTPAALQLIQSQINADAQADYATLDDNNPPLPQVTTLPNATFTREVTENTAVLGTIKHVRYILTWEGTTGPQTVQGDYELTESGLLNAL